MIRTLIRRVIRLAIFAGILAGFYFFGRSYLWPPEDRSTIKVVGMIEAPEVNITSRIGGRIKQLDLLEGDHVSKGQVVAWIEDVDLRNQLAKSQADLAHSQANLAQARRDLARDKTLTTANVLATKALDDALTAVDQDQADVLSAQANADFERLADDDPIDRRLYFSVGDLIGVELGVVLRAEHVGLVLLDGGQGVIERLGR